MAEFVQSVSYQTLSADQEATITVEEVTSDDSDDEVVAESPSNQDLVTQDPSGQQQPPPPHQNPPFQPIPEHKRSFKQMVCLAGLPRSGGTLLTALLSQNPKIHTEGHSPLCQLMWDTYLSYQDKCGREFKSNGKDHMLPQIVGQMPHSYYQHVPPETEIVVDRCRSWMHECNVNMLRGCVDPHIKIIVLERPVREVVASYARLLSKNHMGTALDQVLPQLLQPNTEPILRAMEGVKWSKAVALNHPDLFLILNYEELVTEPQATLQRIYDFCGWTPFEHDLEHVKMRHPEDDAVHGLIGQYMVHEKVAKKRYIGEEKAELPDNVLEVIRDIEKHFETNA